MPSLYLGGYFSQVVISALYPILNTEALDKLTHSNVSTVYSSEIPIDRMGILSLGQVQSVELLVVLSPAPYTNIEQSQKMTAAAVTAVDLVTTIAFVSYTNIEQSQKMTAAAVTAVTLV